MRLSIASLLGPLAEELSPAVAKAADALYTSPLDGFIERRRDLAKALKTAGDAAGAKQIAAMAKPSTSAWVVNQLWWSHRASVEALFAEAKAVRQSPSARPAFDAQLRAVRDLARQTLESAGLAAHVGLLRRVTTTLNALAAVGSFAPDADGRLVADREALGFEAMEGAAWSVHDDEDERRPLPANERAGRHATPTEAPHGRPGASSPKRGGGAPSSADAEHEKTAKEAAARAKEAERRAALEREKAAAALHRELASLREQIDRTAATRARAEHELESIAARRAGLDAEQKKAEATRDRAIEDADRAKRRTAEVERALRTLGSS